MRTQPLSRLFSKPSRVKTSKKLDFENFYEAVFIVPSGRAHGYADGRTDYQWLIKLVWRKGDPEVGTRDQAIKYLTYGQSFDKMAMWASTRHYCQEEGENIGTGANAVSGKL